MKLLIGIVALVCTTGLLASAAWAQGNTSRTYTGTNGPNPGPNYTQTGAGPATGENFVANIYGGENQFAIEVKSPGACNRPFYFTGTVSFRPNQRIGSIGGPMLRCTNQELKDACAKVGIRLSDYYEVGYTGTIERSFDHSTYEIKITYPYVIWVKEDCKEKRETQGTEIFKLQYAPPGPPPRTPGDVVRDANDAADQVIIDAALLKGLREGNLR